MQEFWQGGRGFRAYLYSFFYVVIIGILLLTYFNSPNSTVNFLTNPINNNKICNFIWRFVLIILGLFIVNLPRIYWWFQRNEFNDWVYKYYMLENYFKRNSHYKNDILLDYKLKKIEHRRKKFDDNQQLAMAIWIAGLAIFSAIFIDGIVNNDFLQNDTFYDNLRFEAKQEYIGSYRKVKDGTNGLIVYEEPTLKKPIKVIRKGEIITLTGVLSHNDKDGKIITNVQIMNPLRNTEPLGWVEPKNLALIDSES